jgi:hypothetical protein
MPYVRFAARFFRIAALAPLAAALVACAADEGTSDETTEDDLKSSCTATYRTLQKDAYKDLGGRTTPMWPPHTTTDLSVTCGTTQVGYGFQANYGSKPGEKDKNGRDLLDVVKTETRKGTKAELLALLAEYQGCGCDPSKFLGLSTIQKGPAADLLGQLIPVIERDVTCAGGVKGLVDALKAQDIEAATKLVPTCKFTGNDLKSALDEAMAAVAKSANSTLGEYHVCNNNASLQAELFHGYSSKNSAGFCTTSSALCKGPRWYYTP